MHHNTLLPTILQSNLPIAYNCTSSLSNYIQFAKNFPNLLKEEEQLLFNEFKMNHSLSALRKIIFSHLKYVVWISKKYLHYGLAHEDLIQEGTIGLMKSIKNFKSELNIRLVTYSTIWIKAEIQTYIINNWRLVKVATNKKLKKLFFNLNSLKEEILRIGGSYNNFINNVAEKLKVSKADVLLMDNHINSTTISMDDIIEDSSISPVHTYGLIEHRTPVDILEDNEAEEQRLQLYDIIKTLGKNEQFVLLNKYINEPNKTNREIASELSISSERVRQIEQAALRKMKQYFSTFDKGSKWTLV